MDVESRLPVDRFATVAREFCAWVESPAAGEEEDMLAASRLLAALCRYVLDVPYLSGDEDVEPESLSVEQWQAALARLRDVPPTYYLKFFTPHHTDIKQPVGCSVLDDLSDIYRDLKEGLACYERGHWQWAAFYWRMLYDTHWARHALGAMYALHCRRIDGEAR